MAICLTVTNPLGKTMDRVYQCKWIGGTTAPHHRKNTQRNNCLWSSPSLGNDSRKDSTIVRGGGNSGQLVCGHATHILYSLLLLAALTHTANATATDIALDAKATLTHRIDSLNLLVYTFLLTLTVLTIWLFKHHRVSWLHETGLAVIYGLIVGAVIRYAGTSTPLVHLEVEPTGDPKFNQTLPPDTLWMKFPGKLTPNTTDNEPIQNKTYAYVFRGQVYAVDENEIDLKATFDPEIFFNIILPPIIFHAGYSLKKKYFFRNLGAILMFAILGTTLSSFLIGAIMYGCVKLMPEYLSSSFTFLDTLYFGALISPTDPLTILAIFHDLHVDVNLYALVFGESVLNDAVAIVLSGAIQNYGEHYSSTGGFETNAFFKALSDFFCIFMLSLLIGATMGCFTALLTKFTRVREFPLLESALFVLMSYSTFLIAEASELTGVVAVLFCGICQAHYTYNNLSEDSRTRTKEIFELLNFLAENFIFSYIGVSMFTFPKHHFDAVFIITGFVTAAIGRAVNIYPLSWLLNLNRKPKISSNFQHMLFFAGMRGAMSFALAIRNTLSEARQTMLTTTSLIVIFTVVIQGGASNFLLNWLKIPVGVDEETEQLNNYRVRSVYNSMENTAAASIDTGLNLGQLPMSRRRSSLDVDVDVEGAGGLGDASTQAAINAKRNEKAFLARIWGNFDSKYMKPLLTHSRPTLLETLPVCCNPVARLLTTTEQLTQDGGGLRRSDSDSDICIDDENFGASSTNGNGAAGANGGSGGSGGMGPRRNSINRMEIMEHVQSPVSTRIRLLGFYGKNL
ncbi:PREDICTED: sodium/hydrogen exchanger 6 isoform X3 [Rhagoletis zephyria]|uniref:sodium/hydrogen exchanger 6 isoform X3 n=1 Tax=Rhagoletis zephyria TaxID=28612 RepID=UPI0008118727|nr:PREDICTED: sodium/hydrogen exchanger 6 isoform X3 [Rhagoletis zephyria]